MIASITLPLAVAGHFHAGHAHSGHAHAGHVYGGHWATLLFLTPILIGIALIAVQSVRDRWRGIQPAADPDSADPLPLER